MSVALRSPSAPLQISPGMTHLPSRLYLSDLRHGVPCKFWALTIIAASPRRAASYPLPVRQASALPSASSRFAVARDTLAVRLSLPLAGQEEDFHLKVSAPCRAHNKKPTFPEGDAGFLRACLDYFGTAFGGDGVRLYKLQRNPATSIVLDFFTLTISNRCLASSKPVRYNPSNIGG